MACVGSDLLALEFAPLDSAVAARELDAQMLQRCVRLHLLQLHPIHTSAYVSIRWHTSEYVSIREHTLMLQRCVVRLALAVEALSACALSIREHTSEYISIREHT